MQPWIQTACGIKFDYAEPTPQMIDIRDIAIALSRTARFAGHTSSFYSVAQHSVVVAEYVRRNGGTAFEQQLALLHDATEAYTGDMTAPLKSLMPEFKAVEGRVWEAIWRRFFDSGSTSAPAIPERVKHFDMVALATEARDLFSYPPINDWTNRLPEPDGFKIAPQQPAQAWGSFAATFKNLFGMTVDLPPNEVVAA